MRGQQYLTKPQQYRLVYRKGGSWTSDLVIMRALPNGLSISRFGLSVSRRVSKKAVARNRLKRLLREILREASVNPGWDIVFIVQTKAVSVGYSQLKASVDDLLSLLTVLEADADMESMGGTVTLDRTKMMI